MSRTLAVCHTVHVLSLAVWLGVTLMTGAAAGIVFPTVKAMGPTAPAFAAYPNDAGQHGLIIAGKVASRYFLVHDVVQFVCCSAACVTLGVMLAASRRKGGTPAAAMGARVPLAALALTLVAYQLFVLGPEMMTNLSRHWGAAQAGRIDEALAAKAAFDANHPIATWVMAGTAVIVLALLVLAAWPGEVEAARTGAAKQVKAGEALERPALLKGTGA
ncbi:MAG: hypothetical protein KIT68_12955 [Phycisphaeraceae bacterium]|nr:hypothetical protein [Phycisphaeraceae bacterium]